MLCQVEIRAARNTPQLAPAEGEKVFKICRCIRVVRKLLLLMVAQAQVFIPHAEGEQPLVAVILPVGEPFQLCARLAKEFQLHLLEFSRAEGKVAGGNLIAEGFADLAHAEGDFSAGSALNIREVDENALCRFGAEI